MERKAKCKNVGACTLANKIQIITDDDAELICPECGEPLELCKDEPTGPGSGKKRKKMAALVAAAVVAALAIGAYFLSRGGSSESAPVSPSNIELSKSTGELVVGESDTLHAILSPDGATAQFKWATNDATIVKVVDGVVTAVSPGTAKVGVQVMENKTLKAFCEYTVKEGFNGNQTSTTQNGDVKDAASIQVQKESHVGGTGTLKLAYGTYTGELKNGKPEGQGRLVYTKAHRIAKYDAKERMAQPGESISGVFHNGEITIGKYFDASGNLIETLNIGSVD